MSGAVIDPIIIMACRLMRGCLMPDSQFRFWARRMFQSIPAGTTRVCSSRSRSARCDSLSSRIVTSTSPPTARPATRSRERARTSHRLGMHAQVAFLLAAIATLRHSLLASASPLAAASSLDAARLQQSAYVRPANNNAGGSDETDAFVVQRRIKRQIVRTPRTPSVSRTCECLR